MRLMKSLVVLFALPALCACGGAEKNSTSPVEAAGKPVVRYSRGGDAERRRVIAEAAIGRKDTARKPKVPAAAGAKETAPAVAAQAEPAAKVAPAVAAARPAVRRLSDAMGPKQGAKPRLPADRLYRLEII